MRLFFLLINRVHLGDRVKLLSLVLLARVFFYFVIEASIVSMTFADTVFVSN